MVRADLEKFGLVLKKNLKITELGNKLYFIMLTTIKIESISLDRGLSDSKK